MRQARTDPIEELDTLQRWIESGVEIELSSVPPPQRFDNTLSVRQQHQAVKQRLQEYKDFGAIVPLMDQHSIPPYVQPLHAITKPNAKTRVVVDLSRNLNEHVERKHFHYATVEDAVAMAFPNCFMGKLDLSNCFLSFGMDQAALQYLVFQFEGVLQQFVRLPFGLSSAPNQCTRLLTVPAFAMKERGLTLTSYLDDFFFISSTAEGLTHTLDQATLIFNQMGLVVNPSKREGPTQRLSFLGVEIDSVNQTVACPRSRIDELMELLSTSSKASSLKLQAAQSLIGKLSFSAKVLPGFRPFMRRLHDAVKSRQQRRSNKTTITLDQSWKEDCQFWINNLQHWNGSAKWRSAQSTPVIFATDASIKGFGFYLEEVPVHMLTASRSWQQKFQLGSGFVGSFHESHQDLHATHREIGWSELFALLATLMTYGPLITNQSVLFRCDNESDCHIINRQATSSPKLARMLRRIYAESLRWNLSINARHRSGVDNELADYLSRPLPTSNEGPSEDDGVERVAAWRRFDSNSPTHCARLSFCTMVNSEQFQPRDDAQSSSSLQHRHSEQIRGEITNNLS